MLVHTIGLIRLKIRKNANIVTAEANPTGLPAIAVKRHVKGGAVHAYYPIENNVNPMNLLGKDVIGDAEIFSKTVYFPDGREQVQYYVLLTPAQATEPEFRMVIQADDIVMDPQRYKRFEVPAPLSGFIIVHRIGKGSMA